jgi:hypothetical protein
VKDQIKYQNIHEEPIPEDYRKVLTHVPALITKDGRPLMGPEVKQWVLSMMPTDVESFDHSSFASFDGNPNSAPGLFELESYGAPLAPPLTPELSWKEFIDDRGEEGFKQFLKDLYDRDYLKKTRTQSSKCS